MFSVLLLFTQKDILSINEYIVRKCLQTTEKEPNLWQSCTSDLLSAVAFAVSTCPARSPSSCTGTATCAPAWRSASTSPCTCSVRSTSPWPSSPTAPSKVGLLPVPPAFTLCCSPRAWGRLAVGAEHALLSPAVPWPHTVRCCVLALVQVEHFHIHL